MPVDPAARPTTATALVSRRVSDRYELLELLGEGTLFATFLARDSRTGRDVVVKTLLPQFTGHAELLAALREGVGDVLALSHAGIARPFDVGADESEGIAYYVAEEYAAGMDLELRIRRNAPMSPSVAVDVSICLAEALQYAAERDVHHGDIRPAHVLTAPESPIRLTGWGVSDAQSVAAGENPALLLPSAPYTAPEVFATGTTTTAGDLYALGVVLYQMLTGVLPFAADGDAVAIARRHANAPIPSPRGLQVSVPVGLDDVTRKLLAKRPAERYHTPAGLLADLRAVRDALISGRSAGAFPGAGIEPSGTPADGSAGPKFDDGVTAVMPIPGTVVGGKWLAGNGAKAKPNPISAAVVPIAEAEPPTTVLVSPTAHHIDPEEDEAMAAAIPARKPKSNSFSWLLPLNLFLATVFVATCGYVVNLMFLALEPPTDVVVPNLVGKSLTEAKSLAVESKFLVEVVSQEFNDKYEEDRIYQMRPEAGRHIRENKKVTVWVSKGPRMVTVPDVFDVSFDKARQVLEKAGLRVGEKKYEWDVMTAKGNIVQQIPPAGENRARATRIDLIISKGPEPVVTQEPLPSYEPMPEVPDEGTETTVKEEESSLTVQYDVPADTKSHVIRIDVIDSRGLNTLISESHNAGEKVSLDVTGYGKSITFKVYDNDVLQQKITGPPWSGSGEKAP